MNDDHFMAFLNAVLFQFCTPVHHTSHLISVP